MLLAVTSENIEKYSACLNSERKRQTGTPHRFRYRSGVDSGRRRYPDVRVTIRRGGRTPDADRSALGDVMKESAQAALSYIRPNSRTFGLSPEFNKERIHIHLPEGRIPKDGPSAGITMAMAIVSAAGNVPRGTTLLRPGR